MQVCINIYKVAKWCILTHNTDQLWSNQGCLDNEYRKIPGLIDACMVQQNFTPL